MSFSEDNIKNMKNSLFCEKIIDFIKKNNNPISGEDISRHFNISRAAVWKYIEELREKGYVIKAAPHIGYSLISVPDKLLPTEVQYGLRTKTFGKEIKYYESLESTMDTAFAFGLKGASEGTVICAETQKKGKGRMGRKWESPKGKGLYFSVILRPEMRAVEIAKLTLFSAVAVCEALRNVSGLDIAIKWPNDLLMGNQKIAGILTELSAEIDQVHFVVIGVGINVNTSLKRLPDVATSLMAESSRRFSRIEILQEILRSKEKWYQLLKSEGFDPILKRWKALSSTLGRRVRLVEMFRRREGVAIDLSENGSLLIKGADGEIFSAISGDVEYPDAVKARH